MDDRKNVRTINIGKIRIDSIDKEIKELERLKLSGIRRLKYRLWINYGIDGVTITKSVRRGLRVLKKYKKSLIEYENTVRV